MRRIAICLIVMALALSEAYAIGKKYDSNTYEVTPTSVNTKAYEFGVSYYKNNSVVYFRTDTTASEIKDNKMSNGVVILSSKIDKSGDLLAPEVSAELTDLGVSGSFAYDKKKDKIYFSKYNAIKGVYQLYESSFKDGQWEEAKVVEINTITPSRMNLSPIVNANWDYLDKGASIIQPALANNGNRLYFVSNLKGGQGKTDIWYMDNDGTSWSTPVNAGKGINSEGNEQYPFVLGDSVLYYASDISGEGKYDLFAARINNNQDTTVFENLGQFFNTAKNEYNLITDGNNVFFIAEKDTVNDEIMRLKQLPIPDEIVFAESFAEMEPAMETEPEFNYVLFFFDFDKSQLKSEFEPQIEQVVSQMNQFTDKRFEIAGHTDEKGSEQYNDKLSMKRAKTVKDMLVKKGISKDILVIKAYGEKNPIVKDAQTEDENAKNRRVEIKFYSEEQNNEK